MLISRTSAQDKLSLLYQNSVPTVKYEVGRRVAYMSLIDFLLDLKLIETL